VLHRQRLHTLATDHMLTEGGLRARDTRITGSCSPCSHIGVQSTTLIVSSQVRLYGSPCLMERVVVAMK